MSSLVYTYDGGFITGMTSTGAVAGSVTHAYDDDFRLVSQSVDGADAIAFQYDNDDQVTGAGGLVLARNAQNWLVTGTTLGNVTDQFSYNGFGETMSYSAAAGAANLYSAEYTRDDLGRITQKIETIGGATDTFDYSYDLAGRLSAGESQRRHLGHVQL